MSELKIQGFTMNPFQENTYLVWDSDSKDAALFDPGCSNASEIDALEQFITENRLVLSQLINTHCHIDHVLGNQYFAEKYDLPLQAHAEEQSILEMARESSILYQIPYTPSPSIAVYLSENNTIKIGTHELKIRFTPGHSPGSLCFVDVQQQWALVGDVIFQNSIGRTDLPRGNYEDLIGSIQKHIYTLPNETVLYSGHGLPTTVGHEKKHNPFVREKE